MTVLLAVFVVTEAAALGDTTIDLVLLAKHKEEWPGEVTLTEEISMPVVKGGQQRGIIVLARGTKLKLLELRGDQVKVAYGEASQFIPAKATDLVDRVLAARAATVEAARLEELAKKEAAEKTRRETELRTQLDLEAAKLVIDLPALARKARPAVMLLVVSDASGKPTSAGTGFVVSSDGKLLTNLHVIEKGQTVEATAHNDAKFEVLGVLAVDREQDLALVKLRARELPVLPLGSSGKIEAGFRIAVIGSPLGLEGTLSEGIVSAVREVPDDTGVIKDKWLQITAPISPGSSGSPVISASGEVIGVATMVLRGGQALNFAIPVEAAKNLLKKAEASTRLQTLSEVRSGRSTTLSRSELPDEKKERTQPVPAPKSNKSRGSIATGFNNFGFEEGSKGWNKSGTGHQIKSYVSDGKKPYDGDYAYQTAPGSGPIPYELDALTNELTSDRFLVKRGDHTFSAYIFGGANEDGLYVALCSDSDDRELCRLFRTEEGPTWKLIKRSFRLASDTLVYVQIVDAARGGWGHIAVDKIEVE